MRFAQKKSLYGAFSNWKRRKATWYVSLTAGRTFERTSTNWSHTFRIPQLTYIVYYIFLNVCLSLQLGNTNWTKFGKLGGDEKDHESHSIHFEAQRCLYGFCGVFFWGHLMPKCGLIGRKKNTPVFLRTAEPVSPFLHSHQNSAQKTSGPLTMRTQNIGPNVSNIYERWSSRVNDRQAVKEKKKSRNTNQNWANERKSMRMPFERFPWDSGIRNAKMKSRSNEGRK